MGWDAPQNALDATRYRQMAGRAGRAGIDTHGEAILIAPRKPGVAKKLAELIDVRSLLSWHLRALHYLICKASMVQGLVS